MLMPTDAWRGYEHTKDLTKDIVDSYTESIEALRSKTDSLHEYSKNEDLFMTVGHYLDTHLSPKAMTGAHYLPLHGAQIWGESAARLGLLATTTGAISGYTDSIINQGNAFEGINEYNNTIRRAGYIAPETGMGSLHTKIEGGKGYIATPGLWAIRYTNKETGEVIQKHALHRLQNLEDESDSTVWKIIKSIAESNHHRYTPSPRPASVLEAYQMKIEPGTMISAPRDVTISQEGEKKYNVERNQRILQKTNDILAGSSTHNVGTTSTAAGCIKVLVGYALTYREISEMTGMSSTNIKDIASGRLSGQKHIDNLLQAVQQMELRSTG